jgi:hypothetical protein
MNTDNVIEFPVPDTFEHSPQSLEEVLAAAENIRRIHVDHCLEASMEVLLDCIGVSGFYLVDETYAKDVAMIYASVRSAMLRTKDIVHPFQKISDEVFEYLGDGIVELKMPKESEGVDQFVAGPQENSGGSDALAEGKAPA